MGKYKGLNNKEINVLQQKYGLNELTIEKKHSFFNQIIHTLSEPMFLLLLVTSLIYFVLGEARDGIIMLFFIVGIISIEVIQEWKTDKTLASLKKLSSPKIMVIRKGKKTEMESKYLVPGDIIIIHEGIRIPADGMVLECSSLCVDESSLTGESVPVYKNVKNNKDGYYKNNICYAGTLAINGTGIIKIIKIGFDTEYGKIGKKLNEIKNEKSNLQLQVDKLIKTFVYIALVLCILVILITFINSNDLSITNRAIQSILSGITLAMAMIPEEFPVILTVFLAMGAWRLAKNKSLIKKVSSIETLGAISVLCVDKTGTITKNKMEVKSIEPYNISEKELAIMMGMCCEEETFDPMEIAMLNYCKSLKITKKKLFNGKKIKDYPFTHDFKIMGRAWKIDKNIILSCKGSLENIIKICKLPIEEKNKILIEANNLSNIGYRVIGVCTQKFNKFNDLPESLINGFTFYGLIGLIDPSKNKVKENIELIQNAGIRMCMITGDNGLTASYIAKSVGIQNADNIITGEMLDLMTDHELLDKMKTISIFSRVIPEHKLRIVNLLKQNGEIVAMTGDGVNDAPALKSADIGIAMGKKGTEVAREASDLILLDDNFSTIVKTIFDGRRIYDNIKKAINYILIIHIPIALSSLIAPILGIDAKNLLFLPMQVVLMELIIDPTSSIILERLPAEPNIYNRNPRLKTASLINIATIIKSLIQGLVIFIISFGSYYISLKYQLFSVETSRTIGIMIIMMANIFLVQVNSSDDELAYKTFIKLFKDKTLLLIYLGMILYYIIILYTPLNGVLQLTSLNILQVIYVIAMAFISTYWYELVKIIEKHL